MKTTYLHVEKVDNGFILRQQDEECCSIAKFVVSGGKDDLCAFIYAFMKNIDIEEFECISFNSFKQTF
jgi:hypothetical protein